MSDASVAALLRSDRNPVVVEAPAGCGKTYQGANYARDIAGTLGRGRVLVLTHTHGACGVFAERTQGLGSKVEIKTIHSLIAQIANAYRGALGLPENLTTWAWQNEGEGFALMATKVASFLVRHPMIGAALATRYPVIICDEYQDCDEHQHTIVMALLRAGARVRIFGDPLQWIFGGKSAKAARQHLARWDALKSSGAYDELDHPHRWEDGTPKLGEWVLSAREMLKGNGQINLSPPCPGLTIIRADNELQPRIGYRLAKHARRPLDQAVSADGFMVLGSRRGRVQNLSSFWRRRIPVWEGHTRPGLAGLVQAMNDNAGDAYKLAGDLVAFAGSIGVGFTPASHGERLLREISEGCTKRATGKPANIQTIAKEVIAEPTHRGVSRALAQLRDLVVNRADGFGDVVFDHRSELNDAIRLKEFGCPHEGYAEIVRRRSLAMPKPPPRTLSTIHKAKGLECDRAVIVAADRDQFGDSYYARCKFYVAISRARTSLTLVVSNANPSPLVRF